MQNQDVQVASGFNTKFQTSVVIAVVVLEEDNYLQFLKKNVDTNLVELQEMRICLGPLDRHGLDVVSHELHLRSSHAFDGKKKAYKLSKMLETY